MLSMLTIPTFKEMNLKYFNRVYQYILLLWVFVKYLSDYFFNRSIVTAVEILANDQIYLGSGSVKLDANES